MLAAAASVAAGLELGAEYQRAMELRFFDQHLGGALEPAARRVHDATLGENVWKETSEWPPAGVQTQPCICASPFEASVHST